jgi:signal transduction histidine kinase
VQETVAELRRVERLRDNLTSMIIHDLRSPLSGVMGYADLLKRRAGSKLDAKELGYVQTLLDAAQRLNEMITSLLDTNRLEAGEMPLNVADCDLIALINTTLDQHAGMLGRRQLSRNYGPTPIFARCDADLVRRIMGNLLSNAVKFTDADGEIAVLIEKQSDQAVQVSIYDNGRGIPPESHRKIFEKFGQLEVPTRHSTGLGLTFCKLAIEAQGGAIGVESAVGAGSRFWFTLPAAVGSDA